jgi:hypothetical protein
MITMTAGISSTPARMACSQTAGMSNTVCISGPSGRWTVVGAETVQDLSEFGDIARLDACLAGSLGTVLVTYFDVRCAQSVLLQMASIAEPFQPASHDCRVVSVELQGFCAKMGHAGRFQDFGEVAHVDMFDGQAVVEFYDLRSAQALLTAAGDCASPVPVGASAPPSPHRMRDSLEGFGAAAGADWLRTPGRSPRQYQRQEQCRHPRQRRRTGWRRDQAPRGKDQDHRQGLPEV